jgi:serine O-acetyltransferase
MLFSRENTYIWRYVKTMRYCDYYTTNKHKSPWHGFMYWWYMRKYNKQSVRLGLIIGAGTFDAGICIYHTGNIVVNGYSKIGKNCKLHGSNCIGNSHCKDDCPTIGDNVRLGVGAKVFGKIYIANNVTIAAGAVVTKSCFEEGVTLAGIPAKIIKYAHRS